MSVEITGSGPALTEAELAQFERVQGLILPAQYREFLLQFNGGTPTTSEFDFRLGPYGDSLIDEFYPLNHPNWSVTRAIEIYTDRIADDLMAIAFDPGGNQICIGIEGLRCGGIYFWDHEEEGDEGEPESNVYFIAPSFNEFLSGLQTHPRAEPQPQSAWMNRRAAPPEPAVQLCLWDDETS